MSSWKIVRGMKSNRVRPGNRKRARGAVDVSPQRAKRQHSQGARDVWTQISLSIRVEDLITIDNRADELGLSRSRFLVDAASVYCKGLK